MEQTKPKEQPKMTAEQIKAIKEKAAEKANKIVRK